MTGKKRAELDAVLRDILGNGHCYFQPPESIKLKFPCIIYECEGYSIRHADNIPYMSAKRYSIKLIYKDPDNDLPDKIQNLPMCSFDRRFVSDNLYHDVFIIYW